MARPTTSGLPYLTRRADSGKYAYWRSVPSEFAGTVKGDVQLSWALKPHAVTGQKVIKISLKTGDEALARRRWGAVHPQVEAIFDRTINTAKNAVVPLVAPTRSLSSADRAAIAAQARHDVLSDHDGDWTDAEDMTPIARGLEQALRLRDSGALKADSSLVEGLLRYLAQFPEGMGRTEIRAAARRLQVEGIADMLSSGSTWPLDAPTAIVQEIEIDKNGAGERIISSTPLNGELTQRLAENGLELNALTLPATFIKL